MAHIAFLPFPAYGHINPTLPIVATLVRRGHRVTYATNARFAPLVARTGATVLHYESWLASRPLPGVVTADYLAHEPVRSIDEAIATIPLYEDALGADRPDLLVYDVSTFGAGRVLARKWDRPAVELFATFASNEHYSLTMEVGRGYAPEIDPQHPALVDFFVKQAKLFADHGLHDLTFEEFCAPAEAANLVTLPRSFQPAGETFDDRFAFVGACLEGRDQEVWQPPEDGRPVALVSLGSFHYDHDAAFFRRCVDAFADLPWQVVIAAGDAGVDALGPLPNHVEAHRWVPQLSVLRHADVFITHAGMNSALESLYCGTPMVAVPHMPEQHIVAERVVALGLGARLTREQVTADLLRDAAVHLVTDAEVRRSAAQTSADFRSCGGAHAAADYLEAQL